MSLNESIFFHLIIRARNAAPYITRCIHSVQKQTYTNWKAYLFLDAPTDTTENIARHAIATDARWEIRVNPRRLGVSHNLWTALSFLRSRFDLHTMGSDIVVAIVDGDDYLRKHALRVVAERYESRKCWLTYGSYIKLSKQRKSRVSKPYPKKSDVLQHPWHASHLKTFRAQLLYLLEREQWQDAAGDWLWGASDVALMLPLMAKIGLKHCFHVSTPIYIYRDLVSEKSNRQVQRECEAQVRSNCK